MNRLFRILTVVALVLGLVGPVSVATVFAQTPTSAPAANQTTGTVQGTIKDTSGAPVADAKVTITGQVSKSTTSDANGAFSFTSLAAGIYMLTASKAGYQTATQPDLSVLAGSTETLAIVMPAFTFQSLRTIASVHAVGRGSFNTTPASVSVVTSQQIQEQGVTQVMQVLNQTPGIVASLPSTSANAAAPGAITVPNIRGALSFETASLIDGHPVSVGTYGDYVTTFLNPFMLGNVEVVKGPGVASPEVNYAIGGTVNFETKDPTFTPQGIWQVGTDNFGGSVENAGFSDTLGKLGFVFAYSNDILGTKVQNYQALIPFSGGPQVGVVGYNPATGTGTPLYYNDQYPTPTVPGTVSTVQNKYGLVACCYPVSDLYNNQSELVKLRYKFTPATFLTFTYLGSQTWANQSANTGSLTPSTLSFAVPAGQTYTGSIPNGGNIDAAYVRTGNDQEINNEPILEGDFHTSVGNDTILARYYAAGIDRLVHQGPNAFNQPDLYNFQLFGYDKNTNTVYNGQRQQVAVFDWYDQGEIDRLKGWSLEWDHPFGSDGQDQLTATFDSTNSRTISYGNGIKGGPSAGSKTFTNNIAFNPHYTLPDGSKQLFQTFMLRANLRLTQKLNLQVANYLNSYQSTYPMGNTPGGTCSSTADGSQCLFATTTHAHEDARAALVYRPNDALAVRLSAGSAIAPPYLLLLSSIPGEIAYNSAGGYATQSINSGNLKPETAFGYDLGADYRFRDGVTTASGDLYMTNLFNHFISQTFLGGTCSGSEPVAGGGTCPANTPLYFSGQTNLNNARFEGIEFSLRRRPLVGFGYVAQGALEKAYAYNLPANFYCSFVPTAAKPCIPANYNQNLAILAGQNFTGNAIGGGLNGFSNTNIPYATGYGELNYHFHGGSYALVGATYFGKNNSLFVPPFVTISAAAGYRFGNGLELQLAGSNLTDQYSGLFPNYGGGLFVPLANGKLAASQANVLGPAIYRLNLTKYFGSGTAPTP